jgi:hypothetical protein
MNEIRKVCTYCKKKRNISELINVEDKFFNKKSWICKNHTSILKDIGSIRTNNQKPLFVEFFSGSKHISNYAESLGFEVISVDNVEKFNPTFCVDIQKFKSSMIPRRVSVIWASIPCTTYSIMNISNMWNKISIGYRNYYYIPKNQKSIEALRILNKTLRLIAELNPVYYFIENPRGALRHFPQMKLIPYRKTVAYSDYGMDYYKPTDIFTNCVDFKPIEIKSCVGMEFENSVKNLKNAYERSLIPDLLIKEIFESFKDKFI